MFRRKTYYNAYRGRRSSRSKVMIALSILLLLLVLAALAYFILPEYIVFSAEGFRFTFQQEEDEQPAADGDEIPEDEDLPIVIDGSPATTTPEADPDAPVQEEETSKAPAFPALLGVHDQISNLLRDGYANGLAQAAQERGCSTLVFTVKDASGVVRIPFLSAYATEAAESDDAAAIKEALAPLADDEIYLAARISAFCDNIAPRAFTDNAIRAGSSTWLDQNNQRWLDPRTEMAAEYLCDLIRACKLAGFDAVILDDLCFPYKGRTELISYGEEDTPDARRTALEVLYQSLRRTADSEGISLSVILEDSTADNEENGQYAADLAKYFHTIFVEGDLSAELESALEAAVKDTDCRIGTIHKGGFSAPEGDRSVIAGYLQ